MFTCGAPWLSGSCRSYPHTQLHISSDPISNRFPHRHYQELTPTITAHQHEPAPPSPHFHLVASTRNISSSFFTLESPLLFSRHTSIQPVKIVPRTHQWQHDSSDHTPNPYSANSFWKHTPQKTSEVKRRILQELQTSFKSKAMRNLSSHELSPIETEVLALGDNFVPTTPASTHHTTQS